MNFELVHTFDCDLATYEKLFLDPEYIPFLEKNVPNIDKIEPLSIEDQGSVLKRRIRYSPKAGAYKVGPKTVPTQWTVFEEVSTYDRARHLISFENFPHIPHMLKDKFSNTGTLTLREEGGKVRRVVQGEIHVKIFLLGKIAERIIHKAGADLIEQEAVAMQKFIASRR